MNNHKIEKRAGIFAIIVASILIIAKLTVWVKTGSMSILSSLVDSSLDLITSSINFAAIYYAARPADENHKFGHNSIEDIAGLLQAGFICGSGVFIILEVFNSYIHKEVLQYDSLCIALMIFAIGINFILTSYQKHAIRKTNSAILKADRLHYTTDLLMNSVLLVSFLVIHFYHLYYIDLIGALIIAAYITKSAYGIGKDSFNNLMDKEIPIAERNKIKKIIEQEKQLLSYHDLKTRKRGNKIFLQFHAELNKKLTLEKTRTVIEGVENQLTKSFQNIEIIIKQDPK